jgi:octaprenyl-diphosphate synthase
LDPQWVLERCGRGNTEELRERVILLGGVENTKKRAEEEIAPVLEFVGKFEDSQALLQLIESIVNRDH